jgi:uncharacterized protein DUF5615
VTRAVLLDENIPRGIADGLRAAGHDVLSVAVASSGSDDLGVLALARDHRRVLPTSIRISAT